MCFSQVINRLLIVIYFVNLHRHIKQNSAFYEEKIDDGFKSYKL